MFPFFVEEAKPLKKLLSTSSHIRSSQMIKPATWKKKRMMC
jgi:hypothetical protein